MKDLYSILGVSKDSSEEEIKKAFKKQVIGAHPDKGGDEERAKELISAYHTLADPEERRRFDDEWDLFRDMDEGEQTTSIAGHLTSSSEPFSEEYREAHARLVRQFTQKPLSMSDMRQHFKPFDSQVYEAEEKELKIKLAGNLFLLIREKTKQFPQQMQTVEEQRKITPQIAVELFIRFLSGNLFGAALENIRSYFAEEIKKYKSANPYGVEKLLYEGIIDIFILSNNVTIQAEKLLLSFKKIVDYAKESVFSSMSFMSILFQNKYFRNLYAVALHHYWQTSDTALHEENLSIFNGQEAAKNVLINLRSQLARTSVKDKSNKILKELIRYVRLLYQFEKTVNNDTFDATQASANKAQHYREKAFHVLDWLPAFLGNATAQLLVNILLQAGIAFQRASKFESNPAVKMADEKLALNMYILTFEIGRHNTPDVEQYALIQSLRLISLFRYQDAGISQVVVMLQHRALILANVFPFFEAPQSNLDFFVQENKSLILLRQLLHALIDIVEKNKTRKHKIVVDHSYVDILYYAYEASLKGWYEYTHRPDLELKFRRDLMEELLSEKRWDFADLDVNANSPFIMIERDDQHWMRPIRSLPFPEHEMFEKFRSVDGLEVNFNTGDLTFSFKSWDSSRPPYEKLLTIFDVREMFERNIMGGFFSLDPVDPDRPFHPFQQMIFRPTSLYETQLLNTMLLTDYLLKFFTVGQEVQGKLPYAMRSLDELTKELPEYLKKIIEDFQDAYHDDSPHRFWIEAVEVPAAISQETIEQDGILRMALSEMKMVVRKHKMMRDMRGNLVDQEEDDEGWHLYVLSPAQKQEVEKGTRKPVSPAMIFIEGTNQVYFLDEEGLSAIFNIANYDEKLKVFSKKPRDENGQVKQTIFNAYELFRVTKEIARQAKKSHRFTPEYIFAQEFTAHYNEFAMYFPEFGRLRELSRLAVLVNMLNVRRDENKKIITKLGDHLNDSNYWLTRSTEISVAIQAVSDQYDSAYQKIFSEQYAHFQSVFEKINQDLSQLLSQKTQFLQDLYDKFNKVSLGGAPEEIRRAYRQQVKFALDKILESVRPQLHDYDSLLESFAKNDMYPLASELARINAAAIKKQVREQFPNEIRYAVDQVLQGDSSAIRTIANFMTTSNLSQFKSDVDGKIAQLQYVVTAERNHLQKQLDAHRRLESRFVEIGLGSREQEIDISNKCLWVPSNVRHYSKGGHSRLIYGGVSISPKVRVVEATDFSHDWIIHDAFFRPEQRQVDTQYFVEAKKASADLQDGREDMNLLAYVRWTKATYDKLVEGKAKGIDPDELLRRADEEAKRREQWKKGSTTTTASSSSSSSSSSAAAAASASSSGAGGGTKPPSDSSSGYDSDGSGSDSSGDESSDGEHGPHSPSFWARRFKQDPREAEAERIFDKVFKESTSAEDFDERVQKLELDKQTAKSFDRVAARRGFQDHHIISHTNKATKNHPLFVLAGIDYHSRLNKIYLPEEKSLHPSRSIHIGRHLQKLSDDIRKEMDDIVDLGKAEGWSQTEYQAKLRSLLSAIRQELRKGNIALNIHDRPWAKKL